MFNWDQDDRAEKLKELWLSGMPAKKIAAELGCESKNAVLGKAHRMGLSGKGPKQSTKGTAKRHKKVCLEPGGSTYRNLRGGAGLRPMKSKPIPPRTPEQQSDENARILALKPTVFGIENFEPVLKRHCGYIHGEPSDQARCGRRKLDGLPYCEDHARLCKAPAIVARPYAPMRHALGARHQAQAMKSVAEFLDA